MRKPIPSRRIRDAVAAVSATAAALALTSPARAQDYRIERVASGLNQPTFVTQAPGDPSNILYFTERTETAVAGFNADNDMGKVYRYDLNTRAKTLVLDLGTRDVTGDLGLQTIAFHPDFNNASSAGFRKFYASSAENNGASPPISRVEEYTIGGGGAASLTRTILQYNGGGTADNHTVNWIGFNPAATGDARNYLHIATGDGNGNGSLRPSQDPANLRGKFLRVDVAGPDAYVGDTTKNFAIPQSNPFPAFRAANPGTPMPGLDEILVTGVRNPYRASFDRATGDLYFGDVGENTREEVNVLRAGSEPNGPPVDFGWPQREGTGAGITAPQGTTNPYTGVASRNPIREYARGTASAAIGGYRYHGPVPSLADKYFFGDFVNDKVFMLDFDRDTNPAAFNGANGALTDMTALWNGLVTDPADPNYTALGAGNLFGIDHVVSFGEDNAGNLYIVDFGFGTGFQGQYPAAGTGEIFRVTFVPEPTAAAALTLLAAPLLRRRPRSRSAHARGK